MKYVRFQFYIQSTGITRVTEYETFEELEKVGFEEVSEQMINEVKGSIGIDLKELSVPHNPTNFITFIEMSYDAEADTLIEGERFQLWRSEKRDK
jgi:hypothetical protein